MATRRFLFQNTQGFHEENLPSDSITIQGLYVQNGSSNDTNVLITRDNLNNLTFYDPVVGVTKTLSQLISATSGLNVASFDAVIPRDADEFLGTVSGLPSTPTKVLGFSPHEEGLPVQTGLSYSVQTLSYISNGFKYRIRVLDNEYWPGPGSLTLRVQYIWS